MTPREEIEAMLAARTEALARFDADAVIAFYTEDCELIVNDLPAFTGPTAIRDFFASMFAEGTFEPEIIIQDLRVEGTLAVFYARQLLTLASRREPVTDQYAMRHMATLSKASGRWLIVRSMVSLEGPGAIEKIELEPEA
jgi:uncharacterized protein (TIGR02246 family)